MTLTEFLAAAQFTLREPKKAARGLIAMNLPMSVRWLALSLVAVLSTLFLLADIKLSPLSDDPMLLRMLDSPLMLAAMQFLVLVVSAYLIARIGKFFQGVGNFDDALLLVLWMQAVLCLVQLFQILAMLTFAPLADLVGFVGLFATGWLITNFVAELHGFKSLFLVFVGILLGAFAAMVALSIVLAVLIGVGG